MRRGAQPGAAARIAAALAGAVAAVALLLGAAAPAGADVFGPIALASHSATQQFDFAHDPAICGDGRFLAFDGSYGGVTGVWRRDLRSGAVAEVAPGDAELPSISDDGRFISFTTTTSLSPQDQNHAPDVYVRDMDIASGEEGAFTLASAVTAGGLTSGLTYAYGAEPIFEQTHYGAVASGRTALSADGRKVVFVTTATSDLTDPQTPAEPSTPPLQVAVRDLETGQTMLVSSRRGAPGEPVSTKAGEQVYGAVFSGSLGRVQAFGEPPPYGQFTAGPPLGASISADGSTVAWMGTNVAQQAALLPAESRDPAYTEPLWRRIAPGSETPTERVTGGSDPSDPACAAGGEGSLGNSLSPADPCQGPFATPEGPQPSGIWSGGGAGDFVPRLSGDGYTVAFLARAQLVSFADATGIEEGPADLYVSSMRPGLTRNGALVRVTQLASGNLLDVATDASILDVAVSRDGAQVAFVTRRTRFVLGSPAYVSAVDAQPGMGELFDADLADGTLTRVTRGFEGGAGEYPHPPVQAGRDPYDEGDGALSPSFSGDGNQLAFSSTASNLAYGDGNAPPAGATGNDDGSDAFLVERLLFADEAPAQIVSPAPASPALDAAWRLGVTARPRRDGSVLLFVRVPAAGALRIGARSRLHVKRARSSRRGGGGARHRAVHKASVVTRTVATRAAQARGEELLTIALAPARRFAPLAGRRGGLQATVKLVFAAPGRPPLHEALEVVFARAREKKRGRATRARQAKLGATLSSERGSGGR